MTAMKRAMVPSPSRAEGSSASAPDRALPQVLALARSGRVAEAIASAQALLVRAPRHRAVRNTLGVLLLESGRVAEACVLLDALARELPDSAAVQVNAGNALLASGRHDDALRAFERAVRLEPQHAVNWYGLGRTRQLSGRSDLAIAAYEAALRLDPSHLLARANLSAALNFADRYAEGEQVARTAIASAPADAGAHVNLAIALLSQGRWEDGWSAFEWRTRSAVLGGGRTSFTSPVWDGVPRPGTTLVVHAEQGLGDTIQFVRYLPHLRALGMRVVLVCQRALVRLLQGQSAGVASEPEAILADAVLPVGARVPPHEAHISISSLPHRLRCHTDEAVCVHDRPYLAVEHEVHTVADRPLRVGLVWAGSATHVNDRNRSIALRLFEPLLEDARFTWVSLQADPHDAEAPGAQQLQRGLAGARDFLDTARALARTDLLVTVDSAMAHLAGALGHPAWVLLPRLGLDWRWSIGGLPEGWGETPWYRSVRTLRQRVAGDWTATISDLQVALNALEAKRPRAAPPAD